MNSDITELLSMFRALEANEDAIVVLGDEDAMKVLSSWSKTDQIWRKPKKRQPSVTTGNHAEVWRWLCAGWDIDHGAISLGSGLSINVVRTKMQMLVAARLVYPDGQMSKAARAALQVFVAQKLGIKSKRSPPPNDPPSGKVGN